MLLAACVALAAQPVGYVRSARELRINNVAMPTGGIRVWPVVTGDDLLTGAEPALIRLADGSRVTLAAKSRAKVESGSGDRTIVRLLEGALDFQLSRASKAEIYNRAARQTGASGTTSTRRDTPVRSAPSRARTEALPPVSRWK